MLGFELRPEIRKELKNPGLFVKGMTNVYTGLTVAMLGVLVMLYFYFNDPERVLMPTPLLFLGLGLAGWGEWQKAKGK